MTRLAVEFETYMVSTHASLDICTPSPSSPAQHIRTSGSMAPTSCCVAYPLFRFQAPAGDTPTSHPLAMHDPQGEDMGKADNPAGDRAASGLYLDPMRYAHGKACRL